MNTPVIQIWNRFSDADKQEIFNQVAIQLNLPPAAVEKDWWVTRTLELVFQTAIAPHTVFKGGTSLSKAWKLIERFSEDIDLALDRKFLGFGETLNSTQVRKLRKKSFDYLSQTFLPELARAFTNAGFSGVTPQLVGVNASDDDPVKIAVNYPSVTEASSYLQPNVLLEIGSRSLIEPFTIKTFSSLVGEHFKGRNFADHPISIPVVNPKRTFLEKIFLLHEEFQLAPEKIRTNRKSRHLYDLEKMMDQSFAAMALVDRAFYQHIVQHRSTVTPIRGINYANHSPGKINPLPPDVVMEEWRKDYELMRESMIYTPSIPFEKLISRITELKGRINALEHG